MKSTKPSWKDKIDPAFDKIIKAYIQAIEQGELPANSGWVIPTEETFSILEKKDLKGWTDRYKNYAQKISKTIIKLKTLKAISEKERISKKRKFKKNIFTKIANLPTESQEYYKRKFEPFYLEEFDDNKYKRMSLKELTKIAVEYYVDQVLLELHRNLVEMETELKEKSESEIKKKYIKTVYAIEFLLSIYNAISLLVFESFIYDLIKEASEGNEESFFKALQIDRTIIEFDWAQKMIRKAQLKADETFFSKMAKAITTSPLENNKIYGQSIIVLLLFWRLGLNQLTNNELIELLEECGIKVQEDPEIFRRFVNRLITAENKKDIVTLPESKNQA